MRDALQKLGFADAEETAIGATIVKNEYQRNTDKSGVALACLDEQGVETYLFASDPSTVEPQNVEFAVVEVSSES